MDQKTGTFLNAESGENDNEGNRWLTLTYVDDHGRLIELTLSMTRKQFDSHFAIS